MGAADFHPPAISRRLGGVTLCVKPSCGVELLPEWAFCPVCGTDNRPPESQPKVSLFGMSFAIWIRSR
jgi:hypothetical protein